MAGHVTKQLEQQEVALNEKSELEVTDEEADGHDEFQDKLDKVDAATKNSSVTEQEILENID